MFQASTGLDSKLQEFRGHLTRAAHGVFEQPISRELKTQETDTRQPIRSNLTTGDTEIRQAETESTAKVLQEDKVNCLVPRGRLSDR